MEELPRINLILHNELVHFPEGSTTDRVFFFNIRIKSDRVELEIFFCRHSNTKICFSAQPFGRGTLPKGLGQCCTYYLNLHFFTTFKFVGQFQNWILYLTPNNFPIAIFVATHTFNFPLLFKFFYFPFCCT